VASQHTNLLTPATVSGLIGGLIRAADSLRSSVSKNALLTLTDLFRFGSKSMEAHLEQVMPVALKKACDTNVFIGEAGDQCLSSIFQNCNENKSFLTLML